MFKKDIETNVVGKHVLLIDDVVDTAKTITKVLDVFKNRGALSIELCCLLDKPEGRVVPYEAKYVGKVIPNEFVIGYGLDYNEYYRNLPYIAVVKDEVYK
jgi:hypoxanthine phosphoribosyltransferase